MAFGTAAPRPGASATGLAVLRRVPAETAAQIRIWSRVLAVGLGVGALAGAGQLGIAYGLGLVRFARSFPTGGLWSAQLTWVAWFAALAALAGAAAGARAAARYQLARQLGGRILVAAGAGLGAAVVVPLTALPADGATLIGRTTALPALEAALAATLGMVIGVLAAVAALSVRLVALSVTLLVGMVWLLALLSVVPSLAPTADLPEVRLGVLDLPALGGARSTVAVLSAPVLALLICGAIAVAARSRGLSPLQTAVSSTAAPGLLALVYLVGSPGTGNRSVQAAPYAGALIAVAAGLLVSLVVGVARLPSAAGGGDVSDTDPLPPPAGGPDPRTTAAELPAPAEPPAWAAAGEPVPRFPPADHPEPPPDRPGPAAAGEREPVARPEPPAVAGPGPAAGAAAEAPGGPAAPAQEAEKPAGRSKLRMLPKLPKLPKLPRLPRPGRKERPAEQPPAAVVAAPEPPATAAPAPPEPEPAPAPAPSEPAPPSPGRADPPSPRRRGRRREEEREEHLDWISSLSGGSDPDEPASGRRRLRRDRDDDPDSAAGEPRPLHRPYVSPDRPAPRNQ